MLKNFNIDFIKIHKREYIMTKYKQVLNHLKKFPDNYMRTELNLIIKKEIKSKAKTRFQENQALHDKLYKLHLIEEYFSIFLNRENNYKDKYLENIVYSFYSYILKITNKQNKILNPDLEKCIYY